MNTFGNHITEKCVAQHYDTIARFVSYSPKREWVHVCETIVIRRGDEVGSFRRNIAGGPQIVYCGDESELSLSPLSHERLYDCCPPIGYCPDICASYLDTLFYCPTCRKWWKNRYDDAKPQYKENWRALHNLEIFNSEALAIAAAMLVARCRDVPEWQVRRHDHCRDDLKKNEPGRVGPWRFPGDFKRDYFGVHGSGVIKTLRPIWELKRWLAGAAQSRKERKTLLERSVGRRIRKCGLSERERQFFITAFSAAKVGRWIDAHNNPKRNYEHRRN